MDDKPKSRLLFHYTTAEGVIGILSTQTLHATHIDFLNDASEGKIIRQVLTPIFETELRALLPKMAKRGIFDRATLGHPDFYTLAADSVFEAFMKTTNLTTPFFVVSFCDHKPGSPEYAHGLLSQWRAYGTRGGFALEFDELGVTN